MKIISTLMASVFLLSSGSVVAHDHADSNLNNAVNNNPLRSEKAKARDTYRHPAQTLAFFGLRDDMTVVEVSPGGGWYSDILVAAIGDRGSLFAAHFPKDSQSNYYKNSLKQYRQKIATTPAYSKVILTEFDASKVSEVAPANSADLVLTFRNLHNWYMQQGEQGINNAFSSFYTALKPGGVLGVVEHRLPEGRPVEDMTRSGYMLQSWTIKMAEQAGFELIATSEINANPMDTADHPKGVWTLPPSLRLGDTDREKYIAIGESDRMTLKFRKPEK